MYPQLKLNRRRSLLCIALAAFATVESASAAPLVWDGGSAAGNNWTDPINWSTNVAPPNDGSALIVFSGSARPNPLVDVPFNIFSLGFDPGSTLFTMGGSAITVQNGGISNFDDSQQVINSQVIVAAPQTWTSGINFTSGSLQFGGGVTLNNTLTVSPIGASNTAILGSITGTGNLTKTGPGTLTFGSSAPNSYTGTTTVISGTLALGKVVVDGAITGGSLIIGDGSGPATVRLDAANQIANSVPVIINSGSVLDMNGSGDLFGPLTLAGGFVIGAASVIPGNITATSSPTLSSVISANTLNINNSSTRLVTVDDGPGAVDLEISSSIANSGAGGLTKQGLGVLRFSGSSPNNYTGTTIVNEGTLVLAKTGPILAIAGAITIGDDIGGPNADVVRLDANNQINSSATLGILSSGRLDMGAFTQSFNNIILLGGNITMSAVGGLRVLGNLSTNANTATALISGGAVDLTAGTRTFNIGDGPVPEDLEISSSIINGNLVKAGNGALVLSGNVANLMTATTVNAGSLILRKTGVNAINGSLTIGDNGGVPNSDIVRLDAANQINDTSTVEVTNSGRFVLIGVSDTIGALRLQGGNVDLGGGTLQVNGSLSTLIAPFTASIANGTLNLGSATRTFDIPGSGSLAADLNISATITNGSFAKVGDGILQLSGAVANSQTETTVTDGTLILAKTNVAVPGILSIGMSAPAATVRTLANGQFSNAPGASITIGQSGLLDLQGFNASIRDLNLAGGVVNTGSGTLDVTGAIATLPSANISLISGKLSLNAARIINVATASQPIGLDIAAQITSGSIEKYGPGTLRLGGANIGTAMVVHEGAVILANNLALGNLPLVMIDGTVSSDGATRSMAGGLLIEGNGIVNESASLTFAGLLGTPNIHGIPNLTKNGFGTLAFTQASTFDGIITLNAGTFSASLTSINTFTQQGGTFTGSLTNQGTYNYNSGVFSGTLINDGTVNLNANFIASGGFENHTSLAISNGRTVTVNGAGLRNMGTLTLSGGTLNGSGPLTNDFGGFLNARGTISATLTNFGTIQTSGLLSAQNGGSNLGVISIFSTQSLSLGGAFVNGGIINLYSGGISGSATLTNTGGGQITGYGGITAPLANIGGLITAASANNLVITNLTSNSNGGELRITDGGTLNILNAFSSAGTITLFGPSATLTGGVITNTGTISGKGRLSTTVDNFGVIRAGEGLLTISGPSSANNPSGNIQAPTGGTIFYSQGLATNAGTIALAGGTFDNSTSAINNTGIIDGRGTFRAGALTNNNRISIADGPTEFFGNITNNASITITNTTATFFNPVTNAIGGTIKTTNAISRFLATFINSGTFISDPSDNFFDNLSIGPSGALIGGHGDRFILTGDLVGRALLPDMWQTNDAELKFLGGNHRLSIMGDDLGPVFEGYDNNFAWGILTLGAGNHLSLEGDGAALYVRELILPGGLAQISNILGNSHNIYYDLSNPSNSYLNGQTYLLSGGGNLAPVPEPTMIACASLIILFTLPRRRKNHVC